MSPVLTAQEMREVDYDAVIKLRITEKQLMELAGKESCNILLEKFSSLVGKSVLVLCGKGNNGGDGIVLARHLINHGAKVDLAYLCKTDLLKQDGAASLKILTQYVAYTDSFRIFEADEFLPEVIYTKHYDLIIDAILGTGYKRTDHPKGIKRREANNPYLPNISEERLAESEKQPFELATELRPSLSPLIQEAVSLINHKKHHYGAFVVALDSPTGLDCTTGEAETPCVEADLTIALAFLKSGFFFRKGREVCGEIRVADISIPHFLVKRDAMWLVDEEFVSAHLPVRAKQSAKHLNGKVLIVAGHQSEAGSMMGALLLSLRAALKCGAGYICAAVPPSAFNLVHSLIPEAVLIAQNESDILEKIEWADAVLIGCGLGRTLERQAFIAKLLTSPLLAEKKLVLDADALYAIAELGLLSELRLQHAVLTPHLGEFSRLIQTPAQTIDTDRLYYAQEFVAEYGLGLLLKGAPTLVVSNANRYLCNTGTEALATAGTGDLLAGMITSFAAQGLSLDVASALSAYLHGVAGQNANKTIHNPSAGDILDAL
ncbi:MAG: NAD(P)H-hydrate dehydratase [Chlorobiales bacterium]